MEKVIYDLVSDLAMHVKLVKLKQDKLDVELKEVQREHQRLKRKIEDNDGVTIQEYANMNDISICEGCKTYLSRKAFRLSRDKGYKIGSVTNPLYGRVNTYHIDVLETVFNEEICWVKSNNNTL